MINVTSASYADCNGLYRHQKNLTVAWDPNKAVYKHLTKNRYVYWSNWERSGEAVEWVIGKEQFLSSGSYFHYSKYM